MQIHITRSGQSFGSYTLDEVNAYLQSGHLYGADMAWYEGAAGWMPLSQVPGVQAPASAPPPPPTPLPVAPQPPQQQPFYPQPALHHAPTANPHSGAEGERTVFNISPTLTPDLIWTVLTAGIWLLVLVPKAIANKGCQYKLTTQRLVERRGLVGRHIEEFDLYRIQDVTTSQGVFSRMLGYGTVVVQGRDASSPRLVLTNVNRPLKVKEQIREQMRQSRRNEGIRGVEFG